MSNSPFPSPPAMPTDLAAEARADTIPARPLQATHCTFCGKSRAEVEAMVAADAPTVAAICDECFVVCAELFGKHVGVNAHGAVSILHTRQLSRRLEAAKAKPAAP